MASSSISEHIKIENNGKIRTIKFDNPRRKNAINKLAYKALTAALNDAAIDDTVTVVVLTGVGEFYSSGNDLSAILASDDFVATLDMSQITVRNLIHAFIKFPKLLIAIANGPCIGIAATTIVLCDIVIASNKAYFHTPFTALGICAEGCSSYTFPRILGASKAAEMLLLNHKLTVEEALKFNFISEIYNNDAELQRVWLKIEEYSKLPKESVLVTKNLIRRFDYESLFSACELELIELRKRFLSEEAMEAVLAFASRKSKL